MQPRITIALMITCLWLPAALSDDAKDKDLAALQGTWEDESENGIPIHTVRIVIKDDLIVGKTDDDVIINTGTIRIVDSGTDPKQMNIEVHDLAKPNFIKKQLLIYKIEGDKWTLAAYPEPKRLEKRPPAFPKVGDKEIIVLVFKRLK